MLNYIVHNQGKENWIVLVHGIGGSINTWKKQIEAFSENYNLLVLDLPGHGASQSDVKVNAKNVNKEIKKVLDAEGIKKADFVGMSLGALVIANFAVRHKEYVNSVVFGGAALKLNGIYKFLMDAFKPIKKMLPHRLSYRIFSLVILPKKNHKISRKFFIQESAKMKRKYFMQWVDYMSEIAHSQKLLEKLKGTNKKILFISGDEDTCFIKGTKKAASILTPAKMVLIKKCGHICTIEKAKEFNELALNFLKTVHKPQIA